MDILINPINDPLRSTRIKLENTNTYLGCHEELSCRGEYCTMHNRSEHHMRSFPQFWRGDRGMMERTCPHGIGHPDPDDYILTIRPEFYVHGCDGCCSPIDNQ